MQPLPAPVRSRQQWHLYLVPIRHARLPEFVGVELARDAILVKIAPVLAEFFLAQRLRPRDPVAGDLTLEAAFSASVLHGIDLRTRPVLHEAAAEDAAVMRHVAVEIGRTFPRADRGEMFRLQRH